MFSNAQIAAICVTVLLSVWIGVRVYCAHAFEEDPEPMPKHERDTIRARLSDVLKEIERVPQFPRELITELNDIRVSLVDPMKAS